MASAKVTVRQDKDYPPMAHAGNPVVLHLPNNEATLDGSASKDEVGTCSYQYSKREGLVVHCQLLKPFSLQISNLYYLLPCLLEICLIEFVCRRFGNMLPCACS